ncbi:hypothetical protein RRF57_013317 [Xylaria bambusicola]|uniref:Uncharacterized protein n=1 Tax=Xylaria bambusicola TaxID=326684 RepID=A0AAN7UWK7_9PEZI
MIDRPLEKQIETNTAGTSMPTKDEIPAKELKLRLQRLKWKKREKQRQANLKALITLGKIWVRITVPSFFLSQHLPRGSASYVDSPQFTSPQKIGRPLES